MLDVRLYFEVGKRCCVSVTCDRERCPCQSVSGHVPVRSSGFYDLNDERNFGSSAGGVCVTYYTLLTN
jgi:hypothetical protein